MSDKFDPQIIAELKKQNETLKETVKAQKQTDIEAKKYSKEQVAEIRELASSNKKGVSKAAKEQAANDIKQLDNQARLLGISAEELTARQREKDDIVRIGKFLASSKGLLFQAKQGFLQFKNGTAEPVFDYTNGVLTKSDGSFNNSNKNSTGYDPL